MARFLGFLARYNYDWSRTGQLPAFTAVVESEAFRGLPHRADIAALARTGKQLCTKDDGPATVGGVPPEPQFSPPASSREMSRTAPMISSTDSSEASTFARASASRRRASTSSCRSARSSRAACGARPLP